MDALIESFGSVATYLKMAFVAAMYPFWGPVLKTILREIKLSTLVPRGSLLDKLPPKPPPRELGDDPWVTVPLAAYRSSQASQGSAPDARLRARVGQKRGGFR